MTNGISVIDLPTEENPAPEAFVHTFTGDGKDRKTPIGKFLPSGNSENDVLRTSEQDLTDEQKATVRENLEIDSQPYVLALLGQSLAVGLASVPAVGDFAPDARIKIWNANTGTLEVWENMGQFPRGVGAGNDAGFIPANNMAFEAAKMIIAEYDRDVIVIAEVKSGRPIADWLPGAVRAVNFQNQLTTSGVDYVNAIIWQQGEADENLPFGQYKTDFLAMVNGFFAFPQIDRRTFFSVGEVPGIQRRINSQLAEIAEGKSGVPNIGFVSLKDLPKLPDTVHIGGDETALAGIRHGQNILGRNKSATTTPLSFYETPAVFGGEHAGFTFVYDEPTSHTILLSSVDSGAFIPVGVETKFVRNLNAGELKIECEPALESFGPFPPRTTINGLQGSVVVPAGATATVTRVERRDFVIEVSQALDFSLLPPPNPINLASVLARYSADSGVTLTGTEVTRWEPSFGSGDVTAFGTNPVTLNPSAINSKPALVFDSNTALQTIDHVEDRFDDWTVIVVAKTTIPAKPTQSFIAGLVGNRPRLSIDLGVPEITYDDDTTGSDSVGTDWKILTFSGTRSATGSVLKIYDGPTLLVTRDAPITANRPVHGMTSKFTIGNDSGYFSDFFGEIAEVIIYKEDYSGTPELTTAQNELATIYAL